MKSAALFMFLLATCLGTGYLGFDGYMKLKCNQSSPQVYERTKNLPGKPAIEMTWNIRQQKCQYRLISEWRDVR